MEYNIASIPTEYKGIIFRSRLEARWAACFDIMKEERDWEWIYEPFDLHGWLPDFKWGEYLVEVKPFLNEYEGLEFAKQIPSQFLKNYNVILCGANGIMYRLDYPLTADLGFCDISFEPGAKDCPEYGQRFFVSRGVGDILDVNDVYRPSYYDWERAKNITRYQPSTQKPVSNFLKALK